MKVLIKGERNFFLFQDLVYYFILILKMKWRFPLENKFENGTCSYYIYKSWIEVLYMKIMRNKSTNLSIELLTRLTDWMVTTNIAILKAQKETKKRVLDSHEDDYLNKYSPYFLIEHVDNYENYIVHLEGDIEKLFLSAVSFYEAFKKLDYESIITELKKYYEIDEGIISKEVNLIINNYTFDDFAIEMLKSYEIMEE